MRRLALLATLLLGATGAAMLATLPTRIGATLWHYHLALAAIPLLALPAWRLLQRRRVATLAMAYAGLLTTATGFVMLYTKDLPTKDWMTWWHSITSFAFLGLFLLHWAHNQPRLAGFTRRLAHTMPHGPAAGGAWVAGIALGATTWTPHLRDAFTRENYALLATWALWCGIAITWGLWLWHRRDAWRARLHDTEYRNTARALVDTSLFLACWAALLTGLALLYLPSWFDAHGLKYVSKWWHTTTSILLLALVTLHVGFNARILRAHSTRVDGELGRGG